MRQWRLGDPGPIPNDPLNYWWRLPQRISVRLARQRYEQERQAFLNLNRGDANVSDE